MTGAVILTPKPAKPKLVVLWVGRDDTTPTFSAPPPRKARR